MRTREVVLWIVALWALAALVVSGAAWDSAYRTAHAAPKPVGPLGVCVLMNSDAADTSIVATVTQATQINGVVACETGIYVPVNPK